MPIPFLTPDDHETPFPDVREALLEPNGLLMAGANLAPRRLLSAYRHGIFPWYEEGEPILWWAPDPRCVIWPHDLKISRSLGKTIRSGRYQVTENRAFREVMQQCGAPRAGATGTWITEAMLDAYCNLAAVGAAASVEVWQEEQLVGGLYGIELGRVFIGESMFSRASDASKVALAHLVGTGRHHVVDCQLENDHLISLGATTITRQRYSELLDAYTDGAEERFAQLVEFP